MGFVLYYMFRIAKISGSALSVTFLVLRARVNNKKPSLQDKIVINQTRNNS